MTKKSYNKFVATAATATLVASAIAPVAASADSKQFTDVNERYAPAVDYVVSKGVQGKTSTQFGVQDSIKRVDAAVFIANALDLNKPGSPDAGFSDVPERAKDAVNALKAKGIINGKTETRYGANDVLTRGEVALILANAYNLKGDADSVKFTDVNKNRYGAAVAGLVDAGVTNGISETKFGTDNPVKRGDLAVFLYGLSDETPEVPSTDGITSVKAINDTTVSVNFGEAIDSDFIREAELSGKYFVIYTEGETVQGNSLQSTAINFSSDGKSAEFTLETAIESGKKYHVALLDGAEKVAADVKYTYGPTELKAAAATPEFEVSAVADKIFVKYNTKMKDSAKKIGNYKVYDEGGQELGELYEFLVDGDGTALADGTSEGTWVNLNDKKEVEFQLGTDSAKHLLAGKTYKIVVDQAVKTDDNKTLAESKRTIKVSTPSIDKASPTAKVARVVDNKTLEIIFDQDIAEIGTSVQLNPAQLDLRTSTGKTVDVKDFASTDVEGNKLTIVLDGNSGELEKGTSYKVNIPANIVKNGIFPNATNKATSDLTAKAQDNIAIKSLKAQIVASPKNDERADLILTFDQVPLLNDDLAENIVIVDGKKEFKLNGATAADLKVFGGDTTGKSIIVEDIAKFTKDGSEAADAETFLPRADKSYIIEIEKEKVTTDSFDSTQVTNAAKLKATTSGISVSKPVVDEVRIQSAEKIEIEFKEDIKGTFDPKNLEIKAFVANRSDIFEDATASTVSGAGYYDVKISGKVLTITAKSGVKFPTAAADLELEISKDAFTNASGKVANDVITQADFSDDIIDNAAPVLLMAEKGTDTKEVKLTFTEALVQEGTDAQIGSLFFTDKGENASTGTTATVSGDEVTVTFKEDVTDANTDLSIITVKYTKGNSYYLQDAKGNKVVTQTLKGLAK